MGQDKTQPDAPLVAMLRYHLWANERLLDTCAALSSFVSWSAVRP